MPSSIPIITALAGATMTYQAHRIERRQQRRDARNDFSDRMKMGEQYGIHPLQMLGSAGTAMGTGGANLGSILKDEIASRKVRKEQLRQEKRQHDEQLRLEERQDTREEVQHQRNKEIAQINNAADNMRVQLLLDRENRSPDITDYSDRVTNFLAPGIKAIDGYVEKKVDQLVEGFKNTVNYMRRY